MPVRIKIAVGLAATAFLAVLSALIASAVLFPPPWRWLAAAAACLEVLALLFALDVYVPQVTVYTPCFRRGKKGSRRVALTFDDGPSAVTTEKILRVLKQHGARATFFVLGRSIEGNEKILRRIAEDGHEIGNHGYSHTKMHRLAASKLDDEIQRTERLVRKVARSRTVLLRTPHGFTGPRVGAAARRNGYRIVGWTRGVWDTDRDVTAARIVKRTLRNLEGGEIILLHDARGDDTSHVQRATVEALPDILRGIEALGLSPVPVGDLMSERP